MTSDLIILALETATLGGGVFLARGTNELSSRLGDPSVSHSNSLLADISSALKEAGLTLNDVQGFACASGPGSFTGLRIGIATIKALAATLNLPCVGIPTLEAVAHAAGPSAATVALLPAGRGEVFSQMFSVSSEGEVKALDRARHIPPQPLLESYGDIENLMWAGPGAHSNRELLKKHAEEHGYSFSETSDQHSPGWRLATVVQNLARNVAALALPHFNEGKVQTPQSLSAIYVRPSDAELKQACR